MTLFAILTIAVSANAMSYEQARQEALFLTDKMAYELNLTDAQYEAAYEINLDYLMSVTGRSDVLGSYWERRNLDLSYILYTWQWDAFCAATYFYRPLFWDAGYWHFGIYARYPRRDYFYFGTPHFYVSYRGGHSWRMNGGRSYYVIHHDHYRPGHITRDRHMGMRDGWNRGDYHGHGNSSTRITGGTRRGNGNRYDNGLGRGGRDQDGRNGGVGRDNSGRGNSGHGQSGRGTTEGTPRSSGSRIVGTSSTGSFTQHSIGSTPQRLTGSSTQRSMGYTPQRSTGSISRSTGSISRSAGSISRPTGSINRSTGSISRSAGSISRSTGSSVRGSMGGSHHSSHGGTRSSGGSHGSGSSRR